MLKPLTTVLALTFVSCTARADLVLEAGPNMVSGRWTQSVTVILQHRWANHWVVGLGYVSPQTLDTCGRPDCQWELDQQFIGGVERMFTWRRLSFGLGAYYYQNLDRLSSARINARLSLEYLIGERFTVKFSHISNARSGEEITICNEAECVTDKMNMGLDTLMFGWRF